MPSNTHQFLPIDEANKKLQTSDNVTQKASALLNKDIQISYVPSKIKDAEDTVKWKKPLVVLKNSITDETSENECGLGRCFRPKWMQRLANPTAFMVVYGLLGTIQAMSYIYIVSTLTTIERRFGIPSKTTGMMLSGNEISQILLSLFLSYTGGQRNRPVWLAWGVSFSAISCFILALPHFIYGPGEKALSLTQEYIDTHGINQTSLDLKERMGLCSEDTTPKNCDENEYSKLPPILIFISQFVLGIGTTLYYSLGQTYIDDNTKRTKTPMILGLTLALRTVGPSVGFVIGFLCLSIYVDPWATPLIKRTDPRWIGAWWLGWLFLGTIMLVFSILLAMFPKQLKHTQKNIKKEIENSPTKTNANEIKSNGNIKEKLTMDVPEKKGPPSLKEFPSALKRLLKNKLLVVNIFSGAFYILGASGFITYVNKYIEVQFNKSAASASVIVGPAILMAMVLGFIISGFVISKVKPTPRYLLGWNVVVGVIFVVCELAYMFISCEDQNLVGYNKLTKTVDFNNICNAQCGCENLKYAPVCLVDRGITFFSACHAGCHTSTKTNLTHIYSNCSCIPDDNVFVMGLENKSNLYKYTTYGGELAEGPCETPCGNNFIYFMILSGVMQVLGSSGKIGNILVNYRAVKREDKAFSQGLALLIVSLFAFIPGPILFGIVIDSTCLIWDNNCGQKGNCWLYDKTAFRININAYGALFISIGVILDAIVCYLGRDLNLYDEDEEQA